MATNQVVGRGTTPIKNTGIVPKPTGASGAAPESKLSSGIDARLGAFLPGVVGVVQTLHL